MMDDGMQARRLRACAAVAIAYLLTASAVLGALYVAHLWGIILAPWQREALLTVVVGHLIAAAALYLVILWRRGKRGAEINPLWARLALAILPVIVVISVDRMATVFYKPLRESVAMLQNDPVCLWANRPGWEEERGPVSYRINSAGLRGPEVPLGKRDAERRILFLGDSVAFGVGLNEEDCFVWQVAQLANTLHEPDGTQVTADAARQTTVVNCSVIGYSPWQEYHLLKATGLQYDPDVIVQVFCLNDLGQKYNLVQYGGSTRDLAPPDPSAFEWSGMYRMARALSFQWFGPTRAELKARDDAYLPENFIGDPDVPYIQEAFAATFDNMERIVELAKGRGIPMAIVCFPHAGQIDETASAAVAVRVAGPQRRLAAFCRERGIPFLDLIPAYRAYGENHNLKGDRLFPDGTHPTPEANRVAAEAIHAFLLKLGLLD